MRKNIGATLFFIGLIGELIILLVRMIWNVSLDSAFTLSNILTVTMALGGVIFIWN